MNVEDTIIVKKVKKKFERMELGSRPFYILLRLDYMPHLDLRPR